MPQLEASLTIIILITLKVSFMLLESSIMLLETIDSTGVTYDDRHLRSSYFYSTGHWGITMLTESICYKGTKAQQGTSAANVIKLFLPAIYGFS
jgi:hypothetical protein